MRYLALATDHNGTLASNGNISELTVRAMEQLRVSSRRSMLVTGRRLDDLLRVCSCMQLFNLNVAENGGVVNDPDSHEEARLADRPSKLLIQGLQAREEVVGIGDAENDHSFLQHCECAVAVANATIFIKQIAALVTVAVNGNNIIELIDELIANDLRRLAGTLPQHLILLGKRVDDIAVRLSTYGHKLLVAGPSGCGKSTLTASIIERLIEEDCQVCIVDPEGDYGTLRDGVAFGNQWHAPNVHEVLPIHGNPRINLSINLPGIPLDKRSDFFAQLAPNLPAMRARTGRSYWLITVEAHHYRKYAKGNMRWHSFYFRGPDNLHNLKTQNLVVFSQIIQGIDESTWIYHLSYGDYSRWFRHEIKNDYLADETERVKRRTDLEPGQTRLMIEEWVNTRYTLPE